MNQQLGNDAIKEIRESMKGLQGKDAKAMAIKLAEQHPCTWSHIYKITKDIRQSDRKTRSDKGKRTFELVEGTDVWYAAQLVVVETMDPDQALLTAIQRGYINQPSLSYFQTILCQAGLNKQQREHGRRPYRNWEAEFPLQIIQCDVTALKVRWKDPKTRQILRIIGVDKNHPDIAAGKIRVWQILAVDDFSRRRFLRYVSTLHVTSTDIVEFCCELFNEWGIPHTVYVDNGGEFKANFSRAEQILNTLLQNDGGFEIKRHKAGNPQASGKVENGHKWAEKMDKYVGLAIKEGQTVTLEDLNPFADQICEYYNEKRIQRSIGVKPIVRWHSKQATIRKLPEEIIESALLSQEFDAVLQNSMTVERGGVKYRIPGQQPFVNYKEKIVKIVVPPNIDVLLIKLPCDDVNSAYREVPKLIATADKAGEFKTHAETTGQQLTKRLKKSRQQVVAADKELSKQTGQIAPVPFFNIPTKDLPLEKPSSSSILSFKLPHQEKVISVEEVAAVVPISASLLSEKELDYWEAVVQFTEEFEDIEECKEFLLTIFGEGEIIAESQIEAAIKNRYNNQQQPALKAV